MTKIFVALDNGKSLDEIYAIHKGIEDEKKDQLSKQEEKDYADREMNRLIYNKIKEVYPDEINVLNLMSCAPQGMLLDDLTKAILMSEQEQTTSNKINFGAWKTFIENIILAGEDLEHLRDHGFYDFAEDH